MNNINVNKLELEDNYILVQPDKQPEQTASGIYLPDTGTDKPQTGTVINSGAGVVYEDGLKVVYKKWGGNEIKIGDIEYIFLDKEDILATYEETV